MASFELSRQSATKMPKVGGGARGKKQLVENVNMFFSTVSDINSPLTLEAKLKGVILLSSFCPL